MNSTQEIPSFILEKMDEVKRLCEQTKVAKIGLFGSALREDDDPPSSDLDFVVEFIATGANSLVNCITLINLLSYESFSYKTNPN